MALGRFGHELFRPTFNRDRDRGGWCWMLMKMRVGLRVVASTVESEGRAQFQKKCPRVERLALLTSDSQGLGFKSR